MFYLKPEKEHYLRKKNNVYQFVQNVNATDQYYRTHVVLWSRQVILCDINDFVQRIK